MEQLNYIYKLLIDKIETKFSRYLMHNIHWESRLIAITGSRGVGKTTLMLQRIKLTGQAKNSFYASVDHIYFSKNSIVGLAESLYKYGIRKLYLDEVHKYKNWSQEIKNIYDSFPDMQIVFSGSSLLDIYKGLGDLSRRVIPYHLKGLSFREYLSFENIYKTGATDLQSILGNKADFSIETPLLHFKNYLRKAYYPFYKEPDFAIRLDGIIKAVIETDIPKYMDLKPSTIDKLKQLLQIISENVPFKPNYAKISELIGVSRNTLPDYFVLLEKAGLIMLLREKVSGVRSLGKVQKVYLDNTNISYALSGKDVNTGTLRETFFLNQLRAGYHVQSAVPGDFYIENMTFEIGGKSKTREQIRNTPDSYLVKDEIETGFGNVIPLWHFGMLY